MTRKKEKRGAAAPSKGAPKKHGLVPREEIFALQYTANPNATQAAIAAGYSKRSAAVIATRLLKKVNVAARIAALQKKTEEKLQLSRERLVLELERLAYSNVLDVVEQEEPGKAIRFRDLKDIPPWAAAAIHSVKFHADGTWEFRLHPKAPAKELLAKLMGWMKGPEEGRKGAIEIPNDAQVIVIGGSETEFVLACRRARGE